MRGRNDLVATRLQLANQLRALLESFWPGAAAIFADIDSPIALAFLERYPTPDGATRLGVKRLASFLAQHRYSGRRSPDELLARLRAAPQGLAGPVEAETKGEMVRALVAVLGPLVTRILGRAWLRVLWRAWQDRKPYDPVQHGAANAIG